MTTKTSTSKTKKPELPVKVQALEDAATRIRKFKAEHRDIFRELERLAEDYNQKLQDAETEARAGGMTVGPFVVVGYQTRIDAERLMEELGVEDFQKVGGHSETRTVLAVDKVKFAAYAEAGMIPKDVLDSCYEKKAKFSTPHKVELP